MISKKREEELNQGLLRHEQIAPLSPSLCFLSIAFVLLSDFLFYFIFLLLEGSQSADVVPEGGGFALGLSQHEDLLLGQSSREGGVFLSQQEVIVWSGHR